MSELKKQKKDKKRGQNKIKRKKRKGRKEKKKKMISKKKKRWAREIPCPGFYHKGCGWEVIQSPRYKGKKRLNLGNFLFRALLLAISPPV